MLIKTELGLIPPYYMATSIIPKKVLAKFTRIMRNLWWGHDKDKRKMHFTNWSTFVMEKEQGGLGIRSLRKLNMAMIAKLIWKYLEDEDCLWGQIMKAKYVKNGSFWEVNKPNGCSATWSEMLKVREEMREG